jgi:hypothetical protein
MRAFATEVFVRRIAFFAAILVLLIIGGGLTAQIAANDNDPAAVIPGLLIQTDNPDASVFESTPWKSIQLFLLVGFILFNMIGMGATLAIVMWFLHRQLKKVGAEGGRTDVQPAATSETAVEQT